MFKIGDSNINRAGRPPGTSETKERIEKIVQDVFSVETIKKDLLLLKPKDRLNIYLGLLKYILPTIKTVDMSVNSDMSWAELFTLDFPDE